jgi:hypothetical protein
MDPIAWWGAVIGTGGFAIAVRREVLARRVRVQVDHGWRYFSTDDAPPQFHDLIVYVMVTNTGGRNVIVQHVGWEFLVDTGDVTPDGGKVLLACRAEVPLEEPVVVEPDGIPLKVEARIGQLAHLIDPIDGPARPVAFTGGGGVRWEGPAGPLAQQIPITFDRDKMLTRIAELRANARPPKQMGSPDLFALEPEWMSKQPDAQIIESFTSEPQKGGHPIRPPID